MKKLGVILALILLVAFIAFSASSSGGGPSLNPLGSSDSKYLEKRTMEFLEDIKFKDFDKAASYHSAEDRKDVNIAKLIERMFQVKPEFLDILRYKIVKSEIDSSGDRGRVLTRTVVKVLNTGEIKEPEIIFYWQQDPTEGWVMKLESSLKR